MQVEEIVQSKMRILSLCIHHRVTLSRMTDFFCGTQNSEESTAIKNSLFE